MAEQLIIPEKIKLFNIDIIEASINDDVVEDNLNFEFSVAHNTQHNLKDERVKIELYIKVLSKEGTGIKYHIDFHYHIEDLINHYKLNDKKQPIFSGQFIATLLGISFSTARGVIFQQLQKTSLKALVLPVVSPSKILASRNN